MVGVGLVGLFGAVAVIGGTTKLADVPGPTLRWVIVSVVAVSGLAAGVWPACSS